MSLSDKDLDRIEERITKAIGSCSSLCDEKLKKHDEAREQTYRNKDDLIKIKTGIGFISCISTVVGGVAVCAFNYFTKK